MNFAAARSLLALPLVVWLSLLIVRSEGTDEDGLKFLSENGKKPGVVTLPSGLQYKVLRQGTGKFHPAVSTPCLCHYEGKLLDGTKFDSSYDRGDPTTFAPNQVIKGWTEAMQKMVQGDKWELYIPSELGYGERGSPPKIPASSVLVFQMEMIAIKGDEKDWVPAVRCNPATKEGCNDREAAYVEKIVGWDGDKRKAELERLQKMMVSKSSPELMDWLNRRWSVLQQLVYPPPPPPAETEL
jgi:FKBP-type peptidyl-prolyl cis-trans isomerase FklB